MQLEPQSSSSGAGDATGVGRPPAAFPARIPRFEPLARRRSRDRSPAALAGAFSGGALLAALGWLAYELVRYGLS